MYYLVLILVYSQKTELVKGYTCSTAGLFSSSTKAATDVYETTIDLTHLFRSHKLMCYLEGVLCSNDRASYPLTSSLLFPDLGARVSEKQAGVTHVSIWGPDLILRAESNHFDLLSKQKLQEEVDKIGGILGKDPTTYPSILVLISGGFQWVSYTTAPYMLGWSPEMEFLNSFCDDVGQWREKTDSLIETFSRIQAGVRNMSNPLTTDGVDYKTVLHDINTLFEGELLVEPIDDVLSEQMKILSKDSASSIRRALTLSLLRQRFAAVQDGIAHVFQYGKNLLNHYSLLGELIDFGP